jgi:DNA ligase (NAD+)
VLIEKGGEIIPKVVGVDKKKRTNKSAPVQYVTHCPECNSPLVRIEGEAKHYCPNETDCPPQIKGKIIHFVSRKAMDIGMAEATDELLYNEGLVKNVADLYTLKKEDLLQLDRFADKSADNLIASLERSKQVPLPRVLYALGIRYVGETVAKVLSRHFTSITSLMQSGFDELVEIEEIGEKIARSILDFFNIETNKTLVERLAQYGLKMEIDSGESRLSDKLTGKSIVISGVFNLRSRDDMKNLIETYGGKNVGSISAKTSFLVAGDNMGPSKLEKAKKLGVTILSEDEFLAMLQ